MGTVQVFLIRLILSAVLGFFIVRVFFPTAGVDRIILLAGGMFGLAYLLEYLKKRDKGEGHGE
jgi:hypothetical protein